MSMLLLDFKNTQEWIFPDQALRRKLPDFRTLFDSWTLSQQVPALRQLGRRAVLDFVELVEPDHLEIISQHLGTRVFKDHLDYHTVKEVSAPPESIEIVLNGVESYENFVVSRSDKEVTLSFWR